MEEVQQIKVIQSHISLNSNNNIFNSPLIKEHSNIRSSDMQHNDSKSILDDNSLDFIVADRIINDSFLNSAPNILIEVNKNYYEGN